MVKIRLARHGRKNDPVYRIVAIESGRKRAGKALAILGHWQPRGGLLELNRKELNEWEAKGAQVSEAVKKLAKK